MKISQQDLAFFNNQLASMVKLQTPLGEGIGTLAKEVQQKEFKKLLDELHTHLKNGETLSAALASRGDVFSDTYITLVQAGEASGDLATALESMADYSETTLKLRSSLINALSLPIVTFIVAIGILLFLAIVILPKFSEIFRSMGIDLPWMTQIALNIGDFAQANGALVVLLLFFVPVAFVIFRSLRSKWLDTLILNLPFVGALIRNAQYTRMTMVLAHLLKNGVALTTALELTAKIFNQPVFRNAVEDMKKAVEGGELLSDQCRSSGIFPDSMVWKLSFAEKKGNLAETLEELHKYFYNHFALLTNRAAYLLQPSLVIFTAVIVAFIVLSVFLPIFNLQNQLAGG